MSNKNKRLGDERLKELVNRAQYYKNALAVLDGLTKTKQKDETDIKQRE